MPRFSRTLHDDAGNPIGIACGRTPHQQCSSPGCNAHAGKLCDFPVIRNGKRGTCDRKICSTHSVKVGRDLDYRIPHSKMEPTK